MRIRSTRGNRRPVVLAGWVAAAALVAGTTTATPATGAPVAAEAVAGSHSAGDSLFPTIGNGGYDVTHNAIALAYASSGSIEASTTISATADEALSSFSLDLEGLSVDSVAVDGRSAGFARTGHKLVVTPASTVSGAFQVVVTYHGTPVTHTDPDGSEDGWIPTKDGATVLSEPLGAMTWFPNNNTPRDKATYTMAVTVPKRLEVAGNGDLVARTRHGAATTWTWRQTAPMASYLAMISIGNYHVYHSTMTTTSGRRVPVWSFVEPGHGSMATQRALLPKIIRFHEDNFGAYPFTSVGIVVKDLDVGYSLETQNRPVFDIDRGKTLGAGLMVHELAHQWYGDSVTPKDWGDVWLNEGFATYAEWWWQAKHGGPTRTAKLHAEYDSHPTSASLWSPAPADLKNPKKLFASPVYTRGAMTLEDLRHKVGDSAFDTIVQRWARNQRHGTATTHEFVALAEKVSGRSLDGFFHRWLYVANKPAL